MPMPNDRLCHLIAADASLFIETMDDAKHEWKRMTRKKRWAFNNSFRVFVAAVQACQEEPA